MLLVMKWYYSFWSV